MDFKKVEIKRIVSDGNLGLDRPHVLYKFIRLRDSAAWELPFLVAGSGIGAEERLISRCGKPNFVPYINTRLVTFVFLSAPPPRCWSVGRASQ